MKLSKTKPVRVIPDMSLHQRQFQTHSIFEKRPVYDKDGKIVTYRKVQVMQRDYVSESDLENRGIDSEMFTLDNQLASGVTMKPFSGDFIKPSLEQRQSIAEMTDVAVDVFEKQDIEKQEIKEKELTLKNEVNG